LIRLYAAIFATAYLGTDYTEAANWNVEQGADTVQRSDSLRTRDGKATAATRPEGVVAHPKPPFRQANVTKYKPRRAAGSA